MTREIFIKNLEKYQTSQAPVEIKAKAIEKLKTEFQAFEETFKYKQLLSDITNSASELKSSELY